MVAAKSPQLWTAVSAQAMDVLLWAAKLKCRECPKKEVKAFE